MQLEKPNAPSTSNAQDAPSFENTLYKLAQQARADIDKVDDPRGKVLLETTTEVLLGLVKAHRHFEQGSEKGMRPPESVKAQGSPS